jgi:ATP-dependent Lhr-like helicase
VEKLLQNGRLKCVVCTSSLDLGVDFTPVDHVLQIGSPKGIARLMQRAGRSGHQPQAISRITCVPTHAFQLVEIAAARDAMAKGFIESRTPIVMALDVLVQHLVTLALGNALRKNHILAEIRTTHAYQSLSREAFRWALDFITTGGPTLQAYPDYAKVINKQNMLTVENPAIARRHRMNIGTITSDASVIVKYAKGGVLGRVEESFAARLRAGDIFIFAGKSLEYRRMHHMTLYVRKAKHSKGSVPQWLGGRMPLSTRLGEAVRLKLAETRQVDNPQDVEMQTLAPILNLQKRWSRVPASEELLMETLTTRNGHHMFVFPFEGQLVHEGLAALCAYRLTRIKPITISIAVNDYGFELLSDQSLPLREALDNGLWSTKALFRDIMESLNTSEMARRQFRDIARIAGLVFQGYPGRQKGNRQVQASASLIYSVFERYDPDHRLLQQARQEVLERQLEFHRLKACLERISQRRLQWMHPSHPTPLAFPIMANRLRSHLSSEKLAQQLARMQLQLEKAAERTLSGAVSRNGRRGR